MMSNDFQFIEQKSKDLWQSSIADPALLSVYARRGFVGLKVYNSNTIELYEVPNRLSKGHGNLFNNHDSNSEQARFMSRNKVEGLILANPDFCYFFTGTFDPQKWDRNNFSLLHKSLTRFLRRRGVKYILIPEPHKNGGIHFHGVFDSSVEPFLKQFDASKNLPRSIRQKLNAGASVYNFPEYASMFGWVSVEKIRDFDAVANYVSKYILKAFDSGESRFSNHRFFASLGLNRPVVVNPGLVDLSAFEPVYYSRKIVKVKLKRKAAAFSDSVVYTDPRLQYKVPKVSPLNSPNGR